ncbi:acyl-CoA carboxylase epsilon subunit [Agromyces silvae]|uniref:acyl-CoA carboxylase epsilon subunit n=1 Tax=Agromyces silvae TaxID=3388266 RepID=UPI00280B78D8|nr:acyl-CoA carboxylase epsilon subunit [Agromyces protaetiae]
MMTEQTNEPDLRFLTDVSAEEAAAVTAVLVAVLADRGAAPEAPARPRDTGRWVRAAGATRTPFQPGPGRWSSWGR